MDKNLINNIPEYHCSCCQYRQQNETTAYSPANYQGIFLDKDERICSKCGVKQPKIHMDEFANGMFICVLKISCEQRCSQILAMTKQQI